MSNERHDQKMVDLDTYHVTKPSSMSTLGRTLHVDATTRIVPEEGSEMIEQHEYVTRQEFEESERRTNEKLDSLRREMSDGFLHVVERMDDKFEDVRTELLAQNEEAKDRQKGDRRFLLTTVIAIVGAAETILGAVLSWVLK